MSKREFILNAAQCMSCGTLCLQGPGCKCGDNHVKNSAKTFRTPDGQTEFRQNPMTGSWESRVVTNKKKQRQCEEGEDPDTDDCYDPDEDEELEDNADTGGMTGSGFSGESAATGPAATMVPEETDAGDTGDTMASNWHDFSDADCGVVNCGGKGSGRPGPCKGASTQKTALDATRKASNLSSQAYQSGKASEHRSAMHQHQEAAELHQRTAAAHERFAKEAAKSGNKAVAKAHQQMAEAATAQANAHAVAAMTHRTQGRSATQNRRKAGLPVLTMNEYVRNEEEARPDLHSFDTVPAIRDQRLRFAGATGQYDEDAPLEVPTLDDMLRSDGTMDAMKAARLGFSSGSSMTADELKAANRKRLGLDRNDLESGDSTSGIPDYDVGTEAQYDQSYQGANNFDGAPLPVMDQIIQTRNHRRRANDLDHEYQLAVAERLQGEAERAERQYITNAAAPADPEPLDSGFIDFSFDRPWLKSLIG